MVIVHEKDPTTPPSKLAPKPQKRQFGQTSYFFIIAGLEPKLFVFKSSAQQQSLRAHKNGQFCHQDQPSISPYSKYRDHALIAAKLAPKW